MLSKQEIIELAAGYVCPLGKYPTTPYEINLAKRYAEFAYLVLQIERQNTEHDMVTAASQTPVIHSIEMWNMRRTEFPNTTETEGA